VVTYADLEHFTYADLERLSTPLPAPPRRPKPYAKVRRLLIEGLAWAIQDGYQQPIGIETLCIALSEHKVHGAPSHATTLSLWINHARRAAGLEGGYREARTEMMPSARRLADDRAKLNRAKSG
jgi:hypothetical protein